MSMTKAEKARVAELEHALALARALRFPDYPVPAPMTYDEIKASLTDGGIRYGQKQRVARGWFYHANLGGYSNSVSFGCSDGHSHGRDTDTTTSQGMGRMYRTREEATMGLRHELTTQCAEVLARVDQMLAEAAS